MTQATALFELYKHLPERERKTFKRLIVNEVDNIPGVDKPRPKHKQLTAFKANGIGFKFDREAANER